MRLKTPSQARFREEPGNTYLSDEYRARILEEQGHDRNTAIENAGDRFIVTISDPNRFTEVDEQPVPLNADKGLFAVMGELPEGGMDIVELHFAKQQDWTLDAVRSFLAENGFDHEHPDRDSVSVNLETSHDAPEGQDGGEHQHDVRLEVYWNEDEEHWSLDWFCSAATLGDDPTTRHRHEFAGVDEEHGRLETVLDHQHRFQLTPEAQAAVEALGTRQRLDTDTNPLDEDGDAWTLAFETVEIGGDEAEIEETEDWWIIKDSVLTQDGVYNRIHRPADVLRDAWQAYEGIFATHPHPEDIVQSMDLVAGQVENVRLEDVGSDNEPTVRVVGDFKLAKHTSIDGFRVREENVDKNRETVERVQNGEGVDTSQGYLFRFDELSPEEQDELGAEVRMTELVPDHQAILLDEEGACNWEDGCGVARLGLENLRLQVNEHGAGAEEVVEPPDSIEFTEEGDWTAPSLSDYAQAFDRDPDQDLEAWSREEQDRLRAHHLLAKDGGLESYENDLAFPYRRPSDGAVHLDALRAITSGRGEALDWTPESEKQRARTLAASLLEDGNDALGNTEEDTGQERGGDGAALAEILQSRIDDQLDEDEPRKRMVEQVAERADRAPSTIESVLAGEIKRPPDTVLRAFAAVLNTNAERLIELADEDAHAHQDRLRGLIDHLTITDSQDEAAQRLAALLDTLEQEEADPHERGTSMTECNGDCAAHENLDELETELDQARAALEDVTERLDISAEGTTLDALAHRINQETRDALDELEDYRQEEQTVREDLAEDCAELAIELRGEDEDGPDKDALTRHYLDKYGSIDALAEHRSLMQANVEFGAEEQEESRDPNRTAKGSDDGRRERPTAGSRTTPTVGTPGVDYREE